jgi:predicted 3-demethylubiquinone-9 3-methyltransferase (glyoxalase superfamily)
MLKITPFLMYNDQLEAALNFYVSIFRNSKIVNVTRSGGDGPDSKGAMVSAEFVLEGQPFMAFNGGPHFTFSEGISLFVSCETQAEVDELWDRLSEGGHKDQCGWLTDRFGVSWQIVPNALGQLMGDKDPKKAQAVMQAMLKMTKIDIAGLRRAYEQA